MLTLQLMPVWGGWAVWRSDGVELARYRGFHAYGRALSFASHYVGR